MICTSSSDISDASSTGIGVTVARFDAFGEGVNNIDGSTTSPAIIKISTRGMSTEDDVSGGTRERERK